MKVLVLGGTGAMGVHLVAQLSQSGIETVVTSRQRKSISKDVRYVQGNAHDINFLRSLINERWDAVVDFMIYSTSSFATRVDELLDSTSQYVFISTARVYTDSQQPIVEYSGRLLDCSEDKEFLSSDDYSLSKARQEDLLKHSGRTNWTIVRPYITYDKYRLQLGVLEKEEWLYRALHGRTIVFSRDILSKTTTLTHGFDVAKGIFSLIGKSKSLGEEFHITAASTISWIDVLKTYTEALKIHLGHEPKVILQDLPTFLQSKPAKYQIAYDRQYNRRFDCSKISDFTCVRDFTDPEAGLAMSIEAFLRAPKFDDINWRDEAVRDSQTGDWTPLREIAGIKQKLKYLTFRLLHYGSTRN
jgi:nucleoside-diphosphate-sugar epimerase